MTKRSLLSERPTYVASSLRPFLHFSFVSHTSTRTARERERERERERGGGAQESGLPLELSDGRK